MNIFNSLGSNYDLNFVLKALFAKNSQSYSENLKEFLKKKYGNRAILLYKGREAIGLALEILKLKLPKGTMVAINGFTCFAVYKAIVNEGYAAVCLDLEHKVLNRHSGERSDSRISHGDGRFWTSQNDVNAIENNFDLNFSAKELLKAIKQNPKIKAVMIQNTLGYPCNIEEIAKVCRENNIILIEDLAHSVGAIYANGEEAGSPRCEAGTIGDFVVLSFSQDKIIDAVSGGALIIRNKKYVDQFRHSGNQAKPEHPESLRTMGDSGQDGYQTVTRQARMTDIDTKQQFLDRFYPLFTFIIRKTYKLGLGKPIHFLLRKANLLSKPMQESFYAKCNLPNWYSYLVLENFKNLNKNLAHRKEIASVYSGTLDKKVTSENINSNIQSSANLRYPIFVDNRKSLIEYLEQEGVYVSDIWYDSVSEKCNNCNIAADKILNLPTHKNVSVENAKLLSYRINQWLQSQ